MGKFITLEGIEGVGKTSNLQFIQNKLTEAGHDCVVTREPGGTDLGEALRSLLLHHSDDGLSPDAELLLMFAARAEHLSRVIRPALDTGRTVLCDRFTEATIVLDAPVEVGRARAGSRSAPDRIEREQDEFFQRVRQAYIDMSKQYPHRICLVDASKSLDEVQQQVSDCLIEYGVIPKQTVSEA